MKNIKTIVRTFIIADPTLTSLVPATRIQQGWPTVDQDYPCIVYLESNNFVDDEDYADNVPFSENSEIEFHIFQKFNIDPYPIYSELDRIMVVNGWSRSSSQDQFESDTLLNHRLVRYEKRL